MYLAWASLFRATWICRLAEVFVSSKRQAMRASRSCLIQLVRAKIGSQKVAIAFTPSKFGNGCSCTGLYYNTGAIT